MTRRQNNSILWAALCCIVIAGTFLCSKYLYQLMLIQGDSMYPTYHNMQMVLLDRRDREYVQGDVVAVRVDGMKTWIVKRIVGCPGDYIVIHDSVLLVNNERTSFYQDTLFEYMGILEEGVTLHEDEFFLIGDNVNYSIDSRYEEIGIIKSEQIEGKVL